MNFRSFSCEKQKEIVFFYQLTPRFVKILFREMLFSNMLCKRIEYSLHSKSVFTVKLREFLLLKEENILKREN